MSTRTFAIPKPLPAIRVFSLIVSSLRWVALALILIMLSPLVLSNLENSGRYPVTREIRSWHDRVIATVGPSLKAYVPTKIAGSDRTDLLIAAILAGGAFAIGALRERIARRTVAWQMSRQVAQWKSDMQLADNSKAAQELSYLTKLRSSDRDSLLKIFAETKRKLDSIGREVAFLAIDVVDSTGLKEGEDSAAIEHDFIEYRKMVERLSTKNGSIKSAWTPDGAMICFNDIESAVRTAKDVVSELDAFNSRKLLRREFLIRCGVNAGFVHFDPDAALETISDRVIDVAGHMQKHAAPNSVAVARKVIEPLRDLRGFEPTPQIVDGYEVSRWTRNNEG